MPIVQRIKRKIKKFFEISEGKIPGGKYLFDEKTDSLLYELGKKAREMLETIPMGTRQRILYFPSYYQTKMMCLHDAVMILALQIRGAEIIPVTSGFFYQKEDAIFGGKYNTNRFELQYNYTQYENTLLSSMLQTNTVSLEAFSSLESINRAENLAKSVSFDTFRSLEYHGYDVGLLVERIIQNMNELPQLKNDDNVAFEIYWHTYNIIRLIDAVESIFSVVKPDSVVSNAPFYYKWRIPFYVAQKNKIPFYSFQLSERKNSYFWNNDTLKRQDTSECWDSYYKSGNYKKYETLIDGAINSRINGDIGAYSYIYSASNKTSAELETIQEKIKNRPAVLFAVNVMIDAAVLVSGTVFKSCMETIIFTVDFFTRHNDYVLLLKAHPAEKLYPAQSDWFLENILEKHFDHMPENIIFIPNNTTCSSFDFYKMVNGLIAFTSSTVMEIALLGKSSIAICPFNFGHTGITYVPNTKNEFEKKLLDMLAADPENFDQEIQNRAKAFYFIYNFIGQVHLNLLEGNDMNSIPAKLLFSSIDELKSGGGGVKENLDFFCDSILNKSPIFSENRWPPVTL